MPLSKECERDTGLACLVQIVRYHHLAADAQHIAHESGLASSLFGIDDLVRAGRRLGLKARAVNPGFDGLADMPLPAIARCVDGSFLIVAGVRADQVLVQAVTEALGQRGRDLGIDPTRMVWQLSAGEQQRVEILKALMNGADLGWCAHRSVRLPRVRSFSPCPSLFPP